MPKKIDKYVLGTTLGKGTFSKVKFATDSETKIQYAIKIIDRQMIMKEKMEVQLKREIAIMKILKHKHVIGLTEVLQSQNHIYIVLELVTGGELFDRIGITIFIYVLVKAKRFSEDVARRYFQQLISAVEYCHKCGISHRDLKPENLLLDAEDRVKISDFGLSALTNTRDGNPQLLMTTCGTPNYVAPEVLSEKGYDGFAADIWSCGVILYVMLAGSLPFEDETMKGLFHKIEKGQYKMPPSFPEGAQKLITKMLTVDVKHRIKISEILQDEWFKVGLSDIMDTAPLKLSSEDMKKLSNSAINETIFKEENKKKDRTDPPKDGIKTLEPSQKYHIPNPPMNGFELFYKLTFSQVSLISMIKGGQEAVIRRETICICRGDACDIIDRVMKELKSLKAAPIFKGSEVKAIVATQGQTVGIQMTFHPIVAKICLIEIRRTQGGILEFNKTYRELMSKVDDLVLSRSKSVRKIQ